VCVCVHVHMCVPQATEGHVSVERDLFVFMKA
jgi:hypothetical protein